jgi:predicted SprT family Zn-dependent metalloprotease
VHRQTDERTDEINLNPATFEGRTDAEILSVLVHEMAHLWQQHYGKPGRGRYQNLEWAERMLDLGLTPVSLDRPGKMTGSRVSHTIVEGGPFDVACGHLIAGGYAVEWQSPNVKKRAQKKDKVKYTCLSCGAAAWGKPNLKLVCGDCDFSMA